MTWMETERLQEMASEKAEEIVAALGLNSLPINPLAVAKPEAPRLRWIGNNFRNVFDGRLEYHRSQDTFLLFYNTKYDTPNDRTKHHPRTRYSLAHELGHYYLDHHRAYLMRGGKPHRSRSEFSADVLVEREADAFAAGLLMPQKLVRPLVNEDELSILRIEEISARCHTSLISTAIRAVRLSDFPCALAGIKAGLIAWMFPSPALIRGGCYPGEKGVIKSDAARDRWAAFAAGARDQGNRSVYARHWFRTYERDSLERLSVTEHYLPAPVMDTLLVLLTIPEDELFEDDE